MSTRMITLNDSGRRFNPCAEQPVPQRSLRHRTSYIKLSGPLQDRSTFHSMDWSLGADENGLRARRYTSGSVILRIIVDSNAQNLA